VKRWLVLLLVGLAVVVLLSPGLIGRLAEKNIDRNLGRVDLDNENISITAETFERGWFTSEGRYRILIHDGSFSTAVGSDEITGAESGEPSLVIDTRVDHGLVPLSSLRREGGSLTPALANAVSTVSLDRGDGELIDLPGRIYGFVGLDGASSFRFIMEEGQDVSGNMSTEWSGADITYFISADGLRRSLEGVFEPASFESWGVRTILGETRFSLTQDRHAHRLGEVGVDIELESLVVRNDGDPDVGIGPLTAVLDTRIDDGRAAGNGRLELAFDNLQDLGAADVRTALRFDALDADSLATLVDTWKVLNDMPGGTTGAELSAVEPALNRELEALAARGGQLEITDTRITLPQGNWTMNLSVTVDETDDADQPFSWPTVLLNTRATLDAQLSMSLFDYLVEVNPQLRSAVAGGFLVRKGDRYEIEAELDSGRLLINGAPMNLPVAMPR
jgi:hypothetical protein